MNAKLQKKTKSNTTLMVRLDPISKSQLHRAAKLRQLSLSDYVRQVTVTQAKLEIAEADDQTIRMSEAGQLAFWKALHAPVKLNPAQRQLSAIMRGQA